MNELTNVPSVSLCQNFIAALRENPDQFNFSLQALQSFNSLRLHSSNGVLDISIDLSNVIRRASGELGFIVTFSEYPFNLESSSIYFIDLKTTL